MDLPDQGPMTVFLLFGILTPTTILLQARLRLLVLALAHIPEMAEMILPLDRQRLPNLRGNTLILHLSHLQNVVVRVRHLRNLIPHILLLLR